MKDQMRIGLALGLAAALALGGCALLPKITTPINATEVYALESTYGVAQSVAVGYTALRTCASGTHANASNVCKEPGVVIALTSANKKALIALRTLEDFTRNPANYPTLSYSALIGSARSAIGQFKALEAADGVK